MSSWTKLTKSSNIDLQSDWEFQCQQVEGRRSHSSRAGPSMVWKSHDLGVVARPLVISDFLFKIQHKLYSYVCFYKALKLPNLKRTCLLYFWRLNEGFATYISYKGVKSAEPDWDMDSAFLTEDLHGVLDLVTYFYSLFRNYNSYLLKLLQLRERKLSFISSAIRFLIRKCYSVIRFNFPLL